MVVRMRRGQNEVDSDREKGSRKGGKMHEVLHDRENKSSKKGKSSAQIMIAWEGGISPATKTSLGFKSIKSLIKLSDNDMITISK